jgi:prophage endopeptidase
MTRDELTVLMTLGLLGAMLLGWILHWVWASFARARDDSIDTIETMTERAALAEAKQAEAEAALVETETRLTNALREKEIDLETTMEGLRNARQQISDWQAAYEDLKARKS